MGDWGTVPPKICAKSPPLERCVFHVDRMLTSTRGGGPAFVDACGQREAVNNPIFCGRHKWMVAYEAKQQALIIDTRQSQSNVMEMNANPKKLPSTGLYTAND